MIIAGDFEADLHLACCMTRGPRGSEQVAGTALRIDSRAVTLALPRISKPPQVSETVTVEIPFNPFKCLRIRGRVARSIRLANGDRYVEIRLRSAVFRDVNGGNGVKA